MAQRLLLDPATVVVGDRLRPVDEHWASRLADIIRAEGQLTPIEVCEPDGGGFLLVSGAHRQAACRMLGRTVIADVVEADEFTRRQREVSENYWRKGLSPLERAAFVAELHQLVRLRSGVDPALAGPAVAARARWDKKEAAASAKDANPKLGFVYGWAESVVDEIGLSRSAVFRSLALHRNLPPNLRETLRGHPILRNSVQLQSLAKTEGDQQARLIAAMAGPDGARSLAAAKSRASLANALPITPKSEPELRLARLYSAMLKATQTGERVGMFEHLAEHFAVDFSNFLQRREALKRKRGLEADS